MSKILFDFNNAIAETVGNYGISKKEIADAQTMLESAHRAMDSKEMGFRRLPCEQAELIDDIVRTGARTYVKNTITLSCWV